MVEIREVTNKHDLKNSLISRISFTLIIHFGSPSFRFDELNTLHWKKNPAFEHCEAKYWLAFQDGKIIGQVAGIINHLYHQVWGKKQARFGWIDFVDDPEVSGALLTTVEYWAQTKGMESIHGFNGIF